MLYLPLNETTHNIVLIRKSLSKIMPINFTKYRREGVHIYRNPEFVLNDIIEDKSSAFNTKFSHAQKYIYLIRNIEFSTIFLLLVN